MTSAGVRKLVKNLRAPQQKSLRQFGSVPAHWLTPHFVSKDHVTVLDLIKV